MAASGSISFFHYFFEIVFFLLFLESFNSVTEADDAAKAAELLFLDGMVSECFLSGLAVIGASARNPEGLSTGKRLFYPPANTLWIVRSNSNYTDLCVSVGGCGQEGGERKRKFPKHRPNSPSPGVKIAQMEAARGESGNTAGDLSG